MASTKRELLERLKVNYNDSSVRRNKCIELAKKAGISLRNMQYYYPVLDEHFIKQLLIFGELYSMDVYLEGIETGKQLAGTKARKE